MINNYEKNREHYYYAGIRHNNLIPDNKHNNIENIKDNQSNYLTPFRYEKIFKYILELYKNNKLDNYINDLFYGWDENKQQDGQLYFGKWNNGNFGFRYEGNLVMAKGGKLIGKQKKLDVNKNGKLDAQDFKMLRNKKEGKCDECSQKMNENDDDDEDYHNIHTQGTADFDGEDKLREDKIRFRDELRDAENKLRKITPEMLNSLSEEKMMELEEMIKFYHSGLLDDIVSIVYGIRDRRYENDGYYRISIDEDIIDIMDDHGEVIFDAIDDFAKFFGVDDDSDEEYNDEEDMNENKGMCSECGGMMNEGGMCNECGGKMYESKKRTLKLTESELVSLISRMVESVPGVEVTKRAQKGSKKENDDYMKEVGKKLKKSASFDGADNPKFPKQNGKGEKMAINATPEQDEYTATHRGGTLADLDYDQEPSENFKKRLKMALEGDPKMGNSQDAANVIKTDTGKNIDKTSKKKKEIEKDAKEVSWGHSWKSPEDVVIVKESKTSMSSVLNEEIERMKKMYKYDEKTQ